MKQPDIRELYYITHLDNISSILQHGILSHAQVERQGIGPAAIYDAEIVSTRSERITPAGKSLWEYANLYFRARNPMLYRVLIEEGKENIAVIGVRSDILNQPSAFISVGNAASYLSTILPVREGLREISKVWDVISREWWIDSSGSKRIIMAECLVPDQVPPQYISDVYVANQDIAEQLKQRLRSHVSVIPEPHMFFLPTWRSKVRDLSLIKGDMFFSTMQTLTISVNTVGVMGKGLASRAKYQFPDVYVVYQDVCRSRKLLMGKPYLYKRELLLEDELADEPSSLSISNSNKWFLLFATKKHWREDSDIDGIEQGLQWIVNNYQKQGVKSLAVPALGCGLGGLDWRDVGPLMCRYLVQLNIPVAIYLPRESEPEAETLKEDFLLG